MPRQFRQRQNLQLRLSRPPNSEFADLVQLSLFGLPTLCGSPIRISTLPELTALGGRLLSQMPNRGKAVHAATFIRTRRIVLESRLLDYPRLFRHILIHELFHFVWTRLGNAKRAEFAGLLEREWKARAKGELGESAELKKSAAATERDGSMPRGRVWRDYVCESFCDTAAYIYSQRRKRYSNGLGSRWTALRSRWFEVTFYVPRSC